jgi:tetratricopeptide (TPR) repeat protein
MNRIETERLTKTGIFWSYLNNQGLGIASKINVKESIRDAHQELAEIYKTLKDYAGALRSLKKYKEINDLIFNETSSKKIARMQTRYEMEKKEIDAYIAKPFSPSALIEKVKELLYNLGLDFERKRMFNKAVAVYEHIALAGKYKDIE